MNIPEKVIQIFNSFDAAENKKDILGALMAEFEKALLYEKLQKNVLIQAVGMYLEDIPKSKNNVVYINYLINDKEKKFALYQQKDKHVTCREIELNQEINENHDPITIN